MEHPHNAVLLLCSSHGRGCRAYMCDTSHRHANCLDQFRKASASAASCPENRGDQEQAVKLSCPLCRGVVKDWVVVEPARQYMNAKARMCSLESCGYNGTYGELRKHARMEHPSVRPSDADPERQHNWRRMERQRDIGDLLSTVRPLFIDDEVGVIGNDDVDPGMSMFSSHGFFVYLYIRYTGRVVEHEPENVGVVSYPQVSVSFGPRSGNTRNQRRSRTHLAETFEGDLGSTSRDDNHVDDEDSPSGGVLPASAHRPRTRRQRRMRMPDEEDVL
uniref:Uncharacterized protein n=1 Tax=Anthurium amnicola TaxID=1678845 RepID=A0A1D1XDE6_9ARAE